MPPSRIFVTNAALTSPVPADPRIASLLQSYHAADYRWELNGRWHAMSIGEAAPSLEQAFPEATSFGLLSAWNPYSVERPETVNRAEDARLHAQLEESGLVFRAAFSAARNRTWREPSWIVMDMPVDAFDALARNHGQLATVHARRGEPVRLRMYRAEPAGCPALGCVDWLN
jgi:hypothetical protein